MKALRVEQIAARLEDRFRLLTGGSRTALPRHQTLHALIDWSYNLLLEPERMLLRRLAVFAGGWTLEAAEAVCVGEGVEAEAVLDLMTQLVNKSLILAEREQGQEARYRMLETIHAYALEHLRLAESGEMEALRGKHAQYYGDLILNQRQLWNILCKCPSPSTGARQHSSHLKLVRSNSNGHRTRSTACLDTAVVLVRPWLF